MCWLRVAWRRLWRKDRPATDLEEPQGEYEQALSFAQSFEPRDGIDYRWVCEYAKYEYERNEDVLRTLDAKADSIVHYMGGLFSLVVGAVIYAETLEPNMHIVVRIFVILALGAMGTAAWARKPGAFYIPPTSKKAIDYAHAYRYKAQACFAAQFAAASAGLKEAGLRKARLVTTAFFLALAAIAIPGIIAICL